MQKIGDIPNTRADSNGEFTDGNVAGGVPPTILPAEWFNTIQRELMSILAAADIEADSDAFDQVLLAIQKLVSEEIPELKDASLTQKGIVQLSNATNSTSETLAATPKAVRAVDIASLKIANNLSEITTAGAAAVAQTLLNLGLGEGTKTANGHLWLPGGWLLQWGESTASALGGSTGTIANFPTAFPNACFSMCGADVGNGANPFGFNPISTTQFRHWGKDSTGSYVDTTTQYFAIGY